METSPVVILSAVEFIAPTWTNKQQIAVRLARARPVLYAEPPISLLNVIRFRKWAHLARVCVGRLTPYPGEPALFIYAPPLLLPFANRLRPANSINNYFYTRGLLRSLDIVRRTVNLPQSSTPPIIINYLPTNAPTMEALRRRLPGARLIYDCVDDYASFPGARAAKVRDEERRLARVCDYVSVTTPPLGERFTALGARVVWNPNVADIAHFQTALDPATVEDPIIGAIRAAWRERHPGENPREMIIAVYVGSINFKLDYDLVLEMIRENRDIEFLFVGPDEAGLEKKLRNAAGAVMPHAHFRGARSIASLPGILKGCRLGLIPFAATPHLQSVFPLKFFEYMAAGLSVIATNLPALRPYAAVANLATDKADFLAKLRQERRRAAQEADLPPAANTRLQKRLAAARDQTWEKRIVILLQEGPSST